MLPKKLYLILLLFIIIFHTAKAQETYHADKKYAVVELQEDLDFLHQSLVKVHPGIYWYSTPDSIEAAFARAKAQLSTDMTEREFYHIVLPVLVQVKCGHTYPMMSKAYTASGPKATEYLPFTLLVKDERLFIKGNGSTDTSLKKGDEILELGNIPVGEIIRKARSLHTADGGNQAWKDEFISLFFLEEVYNEYYGGKSPFLIKVQKTDGTVLETTVESPRKMTAPVKPETPLSPRQRKEQEKKKREEQMASYVKFRLSSKDSGAAIIRIKGFSYDKVYGVPFYKKHEQIFKTIAERQVENLVIDLRGNTGGNLAIAENLMSYLIDKPFKIIDRNELQNKKLVYIKTLMKHTEMQQRSHGFQFKGLKQLNDSTYTYPFTRREWQKPAKKYGFSGKVYVLTDGWVFSAGSIFVSSLKKQRNITVVGTETGGAAIGCSGGRISRLILPHTKLRVFFPHFRMYAYTDAAADGHGVIPDYIVAPSLDNKDLFMQKAFELILNQ